VYGSMFDSVKKRQCFVSKHFDSGHKCEGRHTAHHVVPVSRGGTDHDGLLPTCDWYHGPRHGLPGRTHSDVLADLGTTAQALVELGRSYVI